MTRLLCLALFVPVIASACAFSRIAGPDDFARLDRDSPTPAGALVLTFFRTGLGDATLVEFPSGKTLLVDAGIGWRVSEILSYLEWRGIRRLDALLLTHPHIDHYGGMERIVRAVEVGTFYENGVSDWLGAYRRLEQALEERGVPRVVLGRGESIAELAGPEASLAVLYPDRAGLEREGNRNRGSIVLALGHGERRFLLMGDAERREEERLLELEGAAGLRAEILKLGHHGSPGSGSREFLEAVRPAVAVAMGSETFDVPLFYPRPNYRVRRVLAELGTTLFATVDAGMVRVISTDTDLRVQSLAALPESP